MLVVGLVVLVVFLGALTRVTFGFGEAVVAMPLLAVLPVGLGTAASLMAIVGLVLAVVGVLASPHAVDRGVLLRLCVATVAGVPLGLVLLLTVPESVVSALLGAFLVGYGVYALSPLARIGTVGDGWAWPVGVVAGALGGAYSFHGIPVAVYATRKDWSPAVFRGTLQAFFLVSGVLVVAGQALGGIWTVELLGLLLASLPAVAAAVLLGRALHTRIPAHRFQRYVYLLVILLGLVLLLRVLVGS